MLVRKQQSRAVTKQSGIACFHYSCGTRLKMAALEQRLPTFRPSRTISGLSHHIKKSGPPEGDVLEKQCGDHTDT